MGVTIHYRLGIEDQYVEKVLDLAQGVAELMKENSKYVGIPMEVYRYSKTKMSVDIGGCETLIFDFKFFKEYEAEAQKDNFVYDYEVLKENPLKTADQLKFTAGFCKTQYGSGDQHKAVAEIIRVVASHCYFAEVSDEGDYYYTGRIEDAESAINYVNDMIIDVNNNLKTAGFSDDQIIKQS